MAKRFEKAKYYTEKYKDVLLPCKHCGNRKLLLRPREGFWAIIKSIGLFAVQPPLAIAQAIIQV